MCDVLQRAPTFSRTETASLCPAAAASHKALLPPPSTAPAKASMSCSSACASSNSMAPALPQCAATCREVAPLESVWARAWEQQEHARHADSTCGTTTEAAAEDREQAAWSGVTFLAFGCRSSWLSAAERTCNNNGRPENAEDTPTLVGGLKV